MTHVPSRSTPARQGIGPGLNLAGAVLVGYYAVIRQVPVGVFDVVVLAVSFLALAAWVVRALVRRPVVRDIAVAVMILVGSTLVVPTDAILITPALVAVAGLVGELRHRLAIGVGLTAVGVAIVLVTGSLEGLSTSFFFGTLGGYALAFVVGFSRRQVARGELREQELFSRTLEVEREQNRNALLADRASVARDIHDVLAHSLGGLVIQLDAVEALLEAGRVDEATVRVGAARTLAAEGLSEARRAVASLRDPDAQVDDRASDPLAGPDAVARLLEAHASLGGTHESTGLGALAALDDRHRRALAAVVREALSNARRHASGETVTLDVMAVATSLLRVRISNTAPPAAPGSPTRDGHGLVGMRERFAELGDSSSLVAGRQGERFVVEATVEIS